MEQALVPLQIHVGSAVAEDSFGNLPRPMTGFMTGGVTETASTLIALEADGPVKVSDHLHRLSAVTRDNQVQKAGAGTPIQRSRQAQLDAYEAPHNLPIPACAKLAGKSRDQINREIASDQLLAVSFGNRGRRAPEWQLDPVRRQPIQSLLQRAPEFDAWDVYWAIIQPCECLNGRAAVDGVMEDDLHFVEQETMHALGLKRLQPFEKMGPS
ncbi:hypothetical protein [Alcaligenes phenolicus]|uniref:hypothetical protein n=1 Tax=Alcaligenes phenolicus TaxID=232846 RepID=UPI0009F206F0|nr:hypothetical protein [Alcaligenes phenolicus]